MVDVVNLNGRLNAQREKLSLLKAIVDENLRESHSFETQDDSFKIICKKRNYELRVTYSNEIYVDSERGLNPAVKIAEAYERNGMGDFLVVKKFN